VTILIEDLGVILRRGVVSVKVSEGQNTNIVNYSTDILLLCSYCSTLMKYCTLHNEMQRRGGPIAVIYVRGVHTRTPVLFLAESLFSLTFCFVPTLCALSRQTVPLPVSFVFSCSMTLPCPFFLFQSYLLIVSFHYPMDLFKHNLQ
jgi:hypothetical protein